MAQPAASGNSGADLNDAAYWVDPAGTAHERCQLFFTSTGEAIAFDPGSHPEMRWPRHGWALFCPWCGDVWERVVMLDAAGKPKYFEALNVSCARHPDPHEVPGSRLAGELQHLLPILPAGVLAEEFKLYLQQGESYGAVERAVGS